jgi:UPF0755 protein
VTSGPSEETGSDAPEIPDWVNQPDPAPRWEAGEAYDPYEADPVRADTGGAYEEPAYGDPAGYVDPAGYADSAGYADPAGYEDGLERVGRYRDWDRREVHWGRRILATVGVLLILAIIAAVATIIWVTGHLSGDGGAAANVVLPAQADHSQIASDLTKARIVSDSWLFKHYLDYRSYPPLDGGTYTMHKGEGYRAALSDLSKGPALVELRLTIPEGYDLNDIAQVVSKLEGYSAQSFLQVANSGAVRSPFEPAGSNDLEGLVFPDTYFVDPGESPQDILQTMVNRFDQIAGEVGLSNSQASNGLTPYQTVIVASLIEKEAKLEQDRGKIGRVILNRLQAGMKLQIDATVEYAEGVHKTKLLDSDLQTPSPYNTYLHAGLPPGPIANPGEASLQAAVNPTPGTWLYYVLINPDGQHGFATTEQQFDQLLAEAHEKGLV